MSFFLMHVSKPEIAEIKQETSCKITNSIVYCILYVIDIDVAIMGQKHIKVFYMKPLLFLLCVHVCKIPMC